MAEANYVVTGMTCGHCAASVTEEVTAVPGVTTVKVDVATGQLTVVSETEIAEAQVRNAVEEAGYQLVS